MAAPITEQQVINDRRYKDLIVKLQSQGHRSFANVAHIARGKIRALLEAEQRRDDATPASLFGIGEGGEVTVLGVEDVRQNRGDSLPATPGAALNSANPSNPTNQPNIEQDQSLNTIDNEDPARLTAVASLDSNTPPQPTLPASSNFAGFPPRGLGAVAALNAKAAADKAKAEAEKEAAIKKSQIRPWQIQYYSGVQCQIFFEDILVDEIVNIQFSTITNRSPIYGYASQLFDTVANGNLIVQGSFSVNFVEAGYLAILGMAMQNPSYGQNAFGRRSRVVASKEPTTENITQMSYSGDGSASSVPSSLNFSKANSFVVKQAVRNIQGLGNEELRALAKDAKINKLLQDTSFSLPNQINGVTSPTRFDKLPPFDIYGVFGDYMNEQADHTVRCLKHVCLTGHSQSISVSGENILDQFSFVARDLS